MLQHVLLSRSHDPFLARASLFSAIQQQCPLFTPALSSIPRHGLAAHGGGEPEQSRILAGNHPHACADAVRCRVGAARGRIQRTGSIQHRPPRFFGPACCTDPRACIRNSGAQVQGKASKLAPPRPTGALPKDCIPAHASEVKESVPLEPASEEISMPEPPHVRAPWAQLTEEEREEQLAREEQPEHLWHDRIEGTPDALRRNRIDPEPKPAAEPEPGPAPCMYKAPPTGAKFPACRPLDTPHNWHPQGERPSPSAASAWVPVVARRVLLGKLLAPPRGARRGYPLASRHAFLQHRPSICRQPTRCGIQHASPRKPGCRFPSNATTRDAKKATAGRICSAAGSMHTHPLGASAPHHASHGDAGPRTTHVVPR